MIINNEDNKNDSTEVNNILPEFVVLNSADSEQPRIPENAKSILKHRIINDHFKKYVLGNEPNYDFVIKTYSLFRHHKSLMSIAIDYYKILTKGRSKLVRKNSEPAPIRYRERTPSKKNITITIKKREDNNPEILTPENIIQIQLLLHFIICLIQYNIRNHICSKADIVELIINMNNNSESRENITKITSAIKGTCYEQAVEGICGLFNYPKENALSKNLPQLNPNKDFSEYIPTKNITYKNIKPVIFATELTRKCQKYFSNISSYHFIDNLENPNEFILPLIDLWEKISNLVSYEIIHENSENSQILTVTYFVKVANELYSLGNYHMLFSILSGLGNINVSKLEYLWKNKPYLISFHKLNNIVSFNNNFQNYRQEITVTKPIIPYIGIILADFTHLLECDIFNYDTESLNETALQGIYKYCCTIDSYNTGYDFPPINYGADFYIDNLKMNNLDEIEKPSTLSDSKKRSKSFDQKPNKPPSNWLRKNVSSIEFSTSHK